jgi:hypothetical protein
MKKINKKSYKGIDYVRLSTLPPNEAELLKKNLTSRSLIKIMIYDEIIDDCVLYGEYEAWLKNYQPEPVEKSSAALTNRVSLS